MEVLINGKICYSCNEDEIRQAFKELKNAYRHVQQRIATEFCPGQRVSWDSRKRGVKMVGVILRVNRASITIIPDGNPNGRWKVSPSLLILTRKTEI